MARYTLYIYKSSKSFKNGFNAHWSLQIVIVHARLNRTSKLLASPLVTISSWENDPTWSHMFKKRSSFLVKTIGIDAGGFRLGVSGQLGCTCMDNPRLAQWSQAAETDRKERDTWRRTGAWRNYSTLSSHVLSWAGYKNLDGSGRLSRLIADECMFPKRKPHQIIISHQFQTEWMVSWCHPMPRATWPYQLVQTDLKCLSDTPADLTSLVHPAGQSRQDAVPASGQKARHAAPAALKLSKIIQSSFAKVWPT